MKTVAAGQCDLQKSDQRTVTNSTSCDNVSKKNSNRTENDTNLYLWKRIAKYKSIPLVLLAAFCSAMQAILVRYINEDVHAIQISFIRFLLQLSIPIPVMIYKNISPKPESRKVFILLLLRSVFGMVGFTTAYMSYYFMRVGDSTAIIFGSPVFVGIFARIIMKETFGAIDMILVITAISGVFLISQPPFLFGRELIQITNTVYPTQYKGALLAFCTCVCFSLTTVLLRKIGILGVNSFKVVFYYAFIASIGSSLLTTVFGPWTIPPCGFVRYVLVALGSFNCIAQCLLTYSLSIERSVFVSILKTNEVIFAFILEYLLFRDFPGFLSLLGIFLVMTASILASLKKMWFAKKDNSISRETHERDNSNNSLPESTETCTRETVV
ncbi:Solute carrier family 35 member G1 [Holothuria leucospilota]|uniref:Solute carrier family 35 member G1 n=1 Tax=Holothuria leucospilota TaxID=206669 RepID=A0A9Q1H795_HOLLE|nr:Solute carrier family 35 member G1 [Holothuria leucospilota]